MKLALIPPVSLLEHVEETDYQLMLPQLVTNKRYASVYGVLCENPDVYVILDNGAAEGVTISDLELMAIADTFSVDEVVIPDAMGDGFHNIVLASRFFSRFVLRANLKFMFVIQGKNRDEFLMNIQWGALMDEVDVIGIPRHAITTLDHPGARVDLVNEIRKRCDKPIHLLGASPANPFELRDWFVGKELTETIRGTDTSMPFNYAAVPWVLEESPPTLDGINRPPHYFGLPSEYFEEYFVRHNIDVLKGWVE